MFWRFKSFWRSERGAVAHRFGDFTIFFIYRRSSPSDGQFAKKVNKYSDSDSVPYLLFWRFSSFIDSIYDDVFAQRFKKLLCLFLHMLNFSLICVLTWSVIIGLIIRGFFELFLFLLLSSNRGLLSLVSVLHLDSFNIELSILYLFLISGLFRSFVLVTTDLLNNHKGTRTVPTTGLFNKFLELHVFKWTKLLVF